MDAVRNKTTTKTHGIVCSARSGMLFITLPSGRQLAYVKPKIGENRFGGSCITYEGVGGTKKWERLDSYGPKFVENIVQATARDLLCYSMQTLRCCSIVMHIHDEVVIEADRRMSLCRLSATRWDALLPGQTGCCSVPMVTRLIFIRKIEVNP